ncbi:hypothetical protein GPECTOR_11g330 [Gonium pectorale]|uniref:6-phosphofructo-2-kinase domain-containing protein n=1 Tax=Gonium pectorale TaxID=33097 RepID=A0A150GPY1_GONPE|nr:hypothetical protein GPECTOR_11g330 [Gonium pectorale]|eukprot:KXZ51897.1 hypothetical protein GPECTOR_11g330 [Gonium pectorale]
MWEIWRSRSSQLSLHSSLHRNSSKTVGDGSQSPVEAITPLGRIASGTVNFKDLSIRPEGLEPTADADDDAHSEDSTNKGAILAKSLKVPERTKYVIILVGLPGRGKTFLCNKLKRYLNWLGHHTRHFNVGSYRRLQKGDHEVQNADFFDAHNPAGLEARNRALYAALDDLTSYLYSPEGQVAIFDATNTTEERRTLLRNTFHGRFQYLFIESICTDNDVLERNYRFKMQYSPDYTGMEEQQSLEDFKARIGKYEEVYEPINDRNIHYIKLIDMVTGRGHMDVNRISGYLPGKIVFYLMQVCKAGMPQGRRIWLTRHGESEYNCLKRIGGDSNLSPLGEVYARCLPEMVVERLDQLPPSAQPKSTTQSSDEKPQYAPVSVWTSTLRRTIQTARHLPFPKLRWKALDEIQAGACDGLTYGEIAAQFPEEARARDKDKLRYRYPAGESYLDVIQRLEPVIIEMEREKECIVLVGHQAVLRALLGYFMAVPLEKVPNEDIPLHTLLELQPLPDGTFGLKYISMPQPSVPDLGALTGGEASGGLSPLMSPSHRGDVSDLQQLGTAPVAGSAAYGTAAGAAMWGAAAGGAARDAPLAPPLLSQIDAMGSAGVDSPGTIHSRQPSLAAGVAGSVGSMHAYTGGSPASLGSFHFGPVGPGSGLDSPTALTAALAAAEGRMRPVRLPFGATMGGGGSEGGAPLDDTAHLMHTQHSHASGQGAPPIRESSRDGA